MRRQCPVGNPRGYRAPLRSKNVVSRTRPSYAWDLNPDLDPDATVYAIYLRYRTCGMCSFREFKKLGIDTYHLRLFYRMVIFMVRHQMSKDTTLVIKSGICDELYDHCENMCWEATRGWTSKRRKETPGTLENRPLHQQSDESRRRILKGPAIVPGDARKEYNSKRSRPCIGSCQASLFSMELFNQAIQDMGLFWLEKRHMIFIFVFASILDHEGPSQQLKDWELEMLLDGRGYADIRMRYLRFMCYGVASSNYFEPGSKNEAHWMDEQFTGLSIQQYMKLKPEERCKYGLMQ